jgi:hypothetical protein
MVLRSDQPQWLQRYHPGRDLRVVPRPGTDLQIGPSAVEHGRSDLIPYLVQFEPHARVPGTEAAYQVGNQPGAERVLECEHHGAAVRIQQLVERRQSVVEAVQQPVDVPLEHRARVGHPQRTPGPVQQCHTDLVLEPGQRPRHPRLSDGLELAHLGHGCAVGDLLKPAKRIGIHIHDNNSWVG